MSELFNTLLSRYGVSLILAVLIGTIAIWILAHNVSEPGSEVSVAWGLVTYTKADEKAEHTPPSHKVVENPLETYEESSSGPQGKKPALVLEPPKEAITIDQTYYEAEPSASTFSTLRENYGLRQLSALENGLPIRTSPDGTFFFSLLGWFDSDGPDVESDFSGQEAHRYQGYMHQLEFHKSSEGDLFLLGFVSQSDAARITRLDSGERIVTLTGKWKKEFPTMVRLPVSRLLNSSDREVRFSEESVISVLDLALR